MIGSFARTPSFASSNQFAIAPSVTPALLLLELAARDTKRIKLPNWVAAEANVTTDLDVTSVPCLLADFLKHQKRDILVVSLSASVLSFECLPAATFPSKRLVTEQSDKDNSTKKEFKS